MTLCTREHETVRGDTRNQLQGKVFVSDEFHATVNPFNYPDRNTTTADPKLN